MRCPYNFIVLHQIALKLRKLLLLHFSPGIMDGGGQCHRYVRYFLTRVPIFKLTGSQPQALFLLHFGIKFKERYSCFQNSIHLAILSINFFRKSNNVVVMYVTQNGHGFLPLKRKSLYLQKKYVI